MYEDSNHYVVLAKIMKRSRRNGKVKISQVLAREKMDWKEIKEEEERKKVCERLKS